MRFWPFNKSQSEDSAENVSNVSEDRTLTKFEHMSEQLKKFRQNNLPAGFDKKINKTGPYILASFLAWPLYWGCRGLLWKHYRQTTQLPVYIQKTYLQAKFMQLSIIGLGLTVSKLRENIANGRNKNETSNDSLSENTE